MKKMFSLLTLLFFAIPAVAQTDIVPKKDWLINNSSYVSRLAIEDGGKQLTLSNGLVSRVFRTTPNLATVALHQLSTGQNHIRATRPEGLFVIDGVTHHIGGLSGQPAQNYLLPEWVEKLRADPKSFRYVGHSTRKIQKRFEWAKRPKWLAQDAPWPPAGIELTLRFEPPANSPAKGLAAFVHYEIYDGLPLLCKWLSLENRSGKTIVVNRFISEIMAAVEGESNVEIADGWLLPNIHVETDYAFINSTFAGEKQHSVHWLKDKTYKTQVSYNLETPCLLEVRPPEGPEQSVANGETFTTFRAWELFYDSSERERKTLSKRKMYRTIAPWALENPVLMHVRQADEKSVKLAIDQCAETGFELVIMTFGSSFNMENNSPQYHARLKQLADYAHSKNVSLGGYSLLASRAINEATDVINPRTGKRGGFARFGNSPCLGSDWGTEYFKKIKTMYAATGLDVIEHDGSYPGDFCASKTHAGHKGYADSQWAQWKIIADFYKWCRAIGIYLNVPDWYFLNGSNKWAMGYREDNWSLPREQQEIIERQNIHDGTWNATPSMGWMFVPLTQYKGGGAAATIEPLNKHLAHYDRRLANLFGAGVQACYRGPRLYDTPETKAVVKKWVDFYKRHRAILDSDVIHLRRPDGRDWDGLLHVNPALQEKGFLMLYNPLASDVEKEISVPLYYTGLTEKVVVKERGANPQTISLRRDYSILLRVRIPAHSYNWYVLENP
jgi:hypothetical protein